MSGSSEGTERTRTAKCEAQAKRSLNDEPVGIDGIERSEIRKDRKIKDWDIEVKKRLKSKIDFLIKQSIKDTHVYIAKTIGAKPDSIKKYMQTKNIEDIERDSLLIEYNRSIRGELKINNQLQRSAGRKKAQAMNVFKQW